MSQTDFLQPQLGFPSSELTAAVAALRDDLIAEGGPRISTMRNYRFAILPYRPKDEFVLRRRMHELTTELKAQGWVVLAISLHRLMLDRVRAEGPEYVEMLIAGEKRLHAKDPMRAQNFLREKLLPLVEGPEGIAKDVGRTICDFADAHPEQAERTLALVGRAGALYPFFRTSALLKHLDGHTRNVPVVLLYPGERQDTSALSFMGELPADRDYRPRIYP